ncbi:E3 ubiquitin-protein ligase TRIM52-like [Elgaria multicarinata webbii]|uniref:E3 ubiquitin-protein ligase TRIM52-like n=1 Tax=Elgaria multicarinata webbii TaxID=159646 RepID=UPI002FCD18D8
MAAEGLFKELFDAMTCPICLVCFKDPVMLDCGHNFCKACVDQYWAESDGASACPECWKLFQQRGGRPNWQLAGVVQLVKKLWWEMRAEVKRDMCKKHRSPLKLFCKDDQAPLCVVCKDTEAHKGHSIVLVEEVAQELKEKTKAQLKAMEEGKKDRVGWNITKELGMAGNVTLGPDTGHSSLNSVQGSQEHET